MNIHSPEAKAAREERNSQIVYLKQQGLTYSEIAKKYNLAHETVKLICHKLGVKGEFKKNQRSLF